MSSSLEGRAIQTGDCFIQAYREFRDSVDFTKRGILPEIDHLVWCIVMGIPDVPADEHPCPDADLRAIDQRVAILKAVFVEVNRDQPEEFLDQGLLRYDRAGRKARILLEEARPADTSD